MAITQQETIKIVDESTDNEIRHVLYIDGGTRATLTKKHSQVHFHWQVYGPQQWPEAKNLILGLLELSILADQLYGAKNEKI